MTASPDLADGRITIFDGRTLPGSLPPVPPIAGHRCERPLSSAHGTTISGVLLSGILLRGSAAGRFEQDSQEPYLPG